MSGSIAGQVLNQVDGQPIQGATCRLTPPGSETHTDNNGAFTFGNLAAGNDYELTVSKEGFEAGVYGPLVVIDGAPTNLVVALQPKNI